MYSSEVACLLAKKKDCKIEMMLCTHRVRVMIKQC